MTTAQALLCELRIRGVVLRVEGDRLCWAAPSGAMTADLLRQARDHKPDLLALLSAEDAKVGWRAEAMRANGSGHGLPRTIAAEPVPPEGDFCETCGEPQAYGRFPRCTYCALAAALVLDELRGQANERRAS